MIEVFFAGVIVGVVAIIVFACWLADGDSTSNQLDRAEAEIDAEYRRSRRAMNDAAKQSWRNLAG